MRRSLSDGALDKRRNNVAVEKSEVIRDPFHQYFFIYHVFYILTVAVIGTFVLWTSEAGTLTFWEALFASVSAVTCTGLFASPTEGFLQRTVFAWYFLAILGSSTTTAVAIPLIRARQMKFKSEAAPHRTFAAVIVAYAMTCCCVGATLLARALPVHEAFNAVIAAFTNSSFVGDTPKPILRDAWAMVVIGGLVAAGNTLFPVGLRIALRLASSTSVDSQTDDNPATPPTVSYGTIDLRKRGRRRGPGLQTWLKMQSGSQVVHPCLFSSRDTTFIAIAWLAMWIVTFAAIAIPGRGLEGFETDDMRTAAAIAQATAIRFSGISFVDLRAFSTAQLLFIAVLVQVPVWVVFVERQRRQWDCWVETCGPVAQVIFSRTLWLATVVLVILTFEEWKTGNHLVVDGSFAFKVFFEVISAYATTGMTIADAASRGASLSASLCPASQLLIVLVMLAGRHRSIDLTLEETQVGEVVTPTLRQLGRSDLFHRLVKQIGALVARGAK